MTHEKSVEEIARSCFSGEVFLTVEYERIVSALSQEREKVAKFWESRPFTSRLLKKKDDEIQRLKKELAEIRAYCTLTYGFSHPEIKKCPHEQEIEALKKEIAEREAEIAHLKESRSKWAKQSSENADESEKSEKNLASWIMKCTRQMDTIDRLTQETFGYKKEIEDLRWQLGKDASWSLKIRETLRETEKLAAEKINALQSDVLRLRGALQDCISGFKYLKDSPYCNPENLQGLGIDRCLDYEKLLSDPTPNTSYLDALLRVVEAAKEYTTERNYQNVQACREDQDRLEQILLDALDAVEKARQ